MQKKITATAIAILIALTPILGVIPIAPASAAIVTPKITLDYWFANINEEGINRTITIENQLGNPDITEVRIYVPAEMAYTGYSSSVWVHEEDGFIDGTEWSTAGTGPWTVIGSRDSDDILPDGASAWLALALEFGGDMEAGKYTLTVRVTFEGGTTKTVDLTIYYGKSEDVSVYIEEDEVEAGTEIEGTVSLDEAEEVRLLVMAQEPGYGALVTIGWVTTDPDTGNATFTYTPTVAVGYEEENWTFWADACEYELPDTTAERKIGEYTDYGLLYPYDDELYVYPSDPTKVKVFTYYDEEGELSINYLTTYGEPGIDPLYEPTAYEWVWASVTDKYDNPVDLSDAGVENITFTFDALKGLFWDFDEDAEVEKVTAELSGDNPTSSEEVLFLPVETYGTYDMITCKVEITWGEYEGTYSGSSVSLMTSTFADGADIEAEEYEVEAGETTEITVTLNIVQEGVPVTFVIDEDEYNGKFVGDAKKVTKKTDEDGEAIVELQVDTEKDAETTVTATIKKPITEEGENDVADWPEVTDPIVTIVAEPAIIIVKTYEYEEPAPVNITDATERDIIGPGDKLFVAVVLADKYGNEPAYNEFQSSIQVTVTASAGTLSATTTYVEVGKSDNWWMHMYYEAPDATGDITITATAPFLQTGSTEISVIPFEPTVEITTPSADKILYTNETEVTTTIAGYAEVSEAEPTGTVISFLQYSLNGEENISIPITGIEEGQYLFEFDLTLEANATYTLVVYATDTEDYTGVSDPRVITVAPPTAVVTWAEITEAETLNSEGEPQTAFSFGSTVLVSANVTNSDTVSHSMLIAVQVKDPDGTVLPTQYVIVTLEPDQTITPALAVVIPTGYRPGTWKAKIMVLTTWPAAGGVSIAEPVEITFTVA